MGNRKRLSSTVRGSIFPWYISQTKASAAPHTPRR
nr:MAG TPA: hypothetical protein [Caudoviricetes sp.]